MKPTRMPIFSLLSLAIPLLGAAYAASVYSRSSADTIGGAIGHGIAAYMIFAIACILGEAAAIAALVRAERPGWLGVMGVVLNLTAVIPPILVFSK